MNPTPDFNEATEGFMQRATLQEKSLLPHNTDRLLAYADTLFPFYSLRYSPKEWYLGLSHDDESIRGYNKGILETAVSKLGSTREQLPEKDNIVRVLNAEFPPLNHSDIERHAFASFLDTFPESTAIFLVRPPYRDDTDRLIRENPDRLESMNAFRDFIEAIDRKNVEVIWIEKASDIGMTDEDYRRDGAHFSQSGLIKLGNFFVDTIRERNLLKSN